MMICARALLWLFLSLPLVAAAQPPEAAALATRLRDGVEAYRQLNEQLDLQRLPEDFKDLPVLQENLDRLGEQLGALSRLALDLDRDPQGDWGRLVAGLELFENDLRQLQCQSLPLRLWGHLDEAGVKDPQWGLAVARTLEPLPRAKSSFDGELTDSLELAARPGETVRRQIIVVPLARDLRNVRAAVGELKGAQGKLPAGAVTVEAAEPAAVVPRDLSQAFLLTIIIPADTQVGEYRGTLRLKADRVKALELELVVVVGGAG